MKNKPLDKKEIEAFIYFELVNSDSNPKFLDWLFKNFYITEKGYEGNSPKDKSGTFYEGRYTCKNCHNEIEVQIPIGMSVKEYQKKEKCEICKCAHK